MQLTETHTRSLMKALSFRALIVISDFLIISAITHQYNLAVGFVVLSNLSSTIFYFIHERIWNRISWGVKRRSQHHFVKKR